MRVSAPAGVALEPLGESGRIVWGVFRVCQWGNFLFRLWVRMSAPVGVAPKPLGDSGRIVWGIFRLASGYARVHPMGVGPEPVEE